MHKTVSSEATSTCNCATLIQGSAFHATTQTRLAFCDDFMFYVPFVAANFFAVLHAHGFSAGLPRVPTRAADVHQPSESTPSSFEFGVCLPRPTKIKTPQRAKR
jgi:hypothetical protein